MQIYISQGCSWWRRASLLQCLHVLIRVMTWIRGAMFGGRIAELTIEARSGGCMGRFVGGRGEVLEVISLEE